MPTIKLHVSIGLAKCERTGSFHIDDSEWESMSEEERDQFLDEAARDHADNYVNCSAWVEDE